MLWPLPGRYGDIFTLQVMILTPIAFLHRDHRGINRRRIICWYGFSIRANEKRINHLWFIPLWPPFFSCPLWNSVIYLLLLSSVKLCDTSFLIRCESPLKILFFSWHGFARKGIRKRICTPIFALFDHILLFTNIIYCACPSGHQGQ